MLSKLALAALLVVAPMAMPSAAKAPAKPMQPASSPKSDIKLKTSLVFELKELDGELKEMGWNGFRSGMYELSNDTFLPWDETKGAFGVEGLTFTSGLPETYLFVGAKGGDVSVSFMNLGQKPFTAVAEAPLRGYNMVLPERRSVVKAKAGDLVVFKMVDKKGRETYGKIAVNTIGWPMTLVDIAWQRNGTRTLE